MLRKLLPLVVPVIAGALLIGCQGAGTASNGASNAGGTTVSPLKVALIAPSAVDDAAFTQSMVVALERLQASQDLDVAISANLYDVDAAAQAMRDYADKGYDLVIAHGSQYEADVQEIAKAHPDVAFAWGTADHTFGLANVYAYRAAADQGGYVEGVVAALLSKVHKLGVVGPVEEGDAKLYVDGFNAGAKATDPSTTVEVTYTGSFSDVSLAESAAQALVRSGADVLTGISQMTVGAIGVAKDANLPWFGTQSDQTRLAPAVVVASQVYHWDSALGPVLEDIRSGQLGGEVFTIDLANGGEEIVLNSAFPLPPDVKAKADAVITGFKKGVIQTGAAGAPDARR